MAVPRFRSTIIIGALTLGAAIPAAAQGRAGSAVAPAAPATAKPVAPVTAAHTAASPRAAAPKTVAIKAKRPVEDMLRRGANPKGPFARLNLTQRDSIVAKTRELLGVRYRWAGLNPATGLDCSGIVKYVFAKLGVELPHDAAAMARLGGAVPRDTAEMQPGDLLMFGRGEAITHVGIYVGDGMMVHTSSVSRKVIEIPVAKHPQLGGLQWKGVRRVFALDSIVVDGAAEPPLR